MSEKQKQNARISAEWQQDGAAIHIEGTIAEMAALYLSITKALIHNLSRKASGKKVLLATIVESLRLFDEFVTENNLQDYLIDDAKKEEETTS